MAKRNPRAGAQSSGPPNASTPAAQTEQQQTSQTQQQNQTQQTQGQAQQNVPQPQTQTGPSSVSVGTGGTMPGPSNAPARLHPAFRPGSDQLAPSDASDPQQMMRFWEQTIKTNLREKNLPIDLLERARPKTDGMSADLRFTMLESLYHWVVKGWRTDRFDEMMCVYGLDRPSYAQAAGCSDDIFALGILDPSSPVPDLGSMEDWPLGRPLEEAMWDPENSHPPSPQPTAPSGNMNTFANMADMETDPPAPAQTAQTQQAPTQTQLPQTQQLQTQTAQALQTQEPTSPDDSDAVYNLFRAFAPAILKTLRDIGSSRRQQQQQQLNARTQQTQQNQAYRRVHASHPQTRFPCSPAPALARTSASALNAPAPAPVLRPARSVLPRVRFSDQPALLQPHTSSPSHVTHAPDTSAPPSYADLAQTASRAPKFPSDTPGLTAERWLNLMAGHLRKCADPAQLRMFLTLVFTGEAQVWLADLPEETMLNADAFMDAFRERWGDLVRFRPLEVRQALLERKVVQRKQDSVSKYYAHFTSLVKQAKDMSMTDQITWFLDGLQPDLVAHCAVQPDGQPWTSLIELAKFAHGEEARLKASRAALNRSNFARLARTHSQASTSAGNGPKQGGGKRPASSDIHQSTSAGHSSKQQKTSPKGSIPTDKYGPPGAQNKFWKQYTNEQVIDMYNRGVCLECGQQGGAHVAWCQRARSKGPKGGNGKGGKGGGA